MNSHIFNQVPKAPNAASERDTRKLEADGHAASVNTTRLVRLSVGARGTAIMPAARASSPKWLRKLFMCLQVIVFGSFVMTCGYGLFTPSIEGLYEIESYASSSLAQVIALGAVLLAFVGLTLMRDFRALTPAACSLLLAFVLSVAFNMRTNQDSFFALANWRALIHTDDQAELAFDEPADVVDGIRYDARNEVYFVDAERGYLEEFEELVVVER